MCGILWGFVLPCVFKNYRVIQWTTFWNHCTTIVSPICFEHSTPIFVASSSNRDLVVKLRGFHPIEFRMDTETCHCLKGHTLDLHPTQDAILATVWWHQTCLGSRIPTTKRTHLPRLHPGCGVDPRHVCSVQALLNSNLISRFNQPFPGGFTLISVPPRQEWFGKGILELLNSLDSVKWFSNPWYCR